MNSLICNYNEEIKKNISNLHCSVDVFFREIDESISEEMKEIKNSKENLQLLADITDFISSNSKKQLLLFNDPQVEDHSYNMLKNNPSQQKISINLEAYTKKIKKVKKHIRKLRKAIIETRNNYGNKQAKRWNSISNVELFENINKIIQEKLGISQECIERIWEIESFESHLEDDDDREFKVFFLRLVRCDFDFLDLHFSNVTDTNYLNLICKRKKVTLIDIFDANLNIFMTEWSRNLFYKEFMKNKLFKSLNKKRSEMLSIINVKDYKLRKDYSKMENMRLISLSQEEVVFEFDYEFRGELRIDLSFTFHIPSSILNRDIKFDLEIPIREIISVIRLCYRPRAVGKSTFSFMGLPQMKYEFKPTINDIDFNLNLNHFNIQDLIIKHGFRGFIYPQWTSIGIPMTKKRKVFKPGC